MFFFHNINSNPTPRASTSSRIGPLTFSFGNKGHSEGGCERSLSKKTSYLQKFPTAQITNSTRFICRLFIQFNLRYLLLGFRKTYEDFFISL